jgi:hypothetical protein
MGYLINTICVFTAECIAQAYSVIAYISVTKRRKLMAWQGIYSSVTKWT